MKKAPLLIIYILLIFAPLCLVGCLDAEFEMNINENGTAQILLSVAGKEEASGIVEKVKDAMQKSLPDGKVRPITKDGLPGYELSEDGIKLESLLDKTSNGENYIKKETGFWTDTYSIHYVIKGSGIMKELHQTSVITEKLPVKITANINLPRKAISHNADSVSEDLHALHWDLSPCFLKGEDKEIEVTFTIISKAKIGAAIIIAAILFGIFGSIYSFVYINRRQKKLEEELSAS